MHHFANVKHGNSQLKKIQLMFLYKHAIKITNASVSYNCTGYLCLQIQNKALVTGSHKYSTGRGIGKSSKLEKIN